jgi:chromosomal replication initiator protein
MQFIFDFPVTPRYSFANFVVCAGNKTASQFAHKLLDPQESESLLYLYGPPGSGKTHLLMALAAAMNPPPVTLSFKGSELLPGGRRLSELFHSSPALLLDDLHLLPDDQDLRVELWQLFNDFYSAGRPIVVTATCPPKEIATIDDHLISRLLWGLVAKVDISDDDSRRMIMKKLAEDRQIILPADVIDHLLIHVQRDIPVLIAALETIKRYALTTQRKITVRLAREALAAPPETA